MKRIYILAVFLAVIAGIAVFFFFTALANKEDNVGIDKKNAVLAVVALPANTLITEEMISVQSLPAEAVNPQTFSNAADVIGSITKYPIAAAEQVMHSKISATGESAEKLSYSLDIGQRAITIKVNSVAGLAGNLVPGDFVDIMCTMLVPDATGETLQPASMLITQKVMILETGMRATTAGEAANPTQYGIVTVAGTPEQVLQIYYAITTAYSAGDQKILLVMRPALDEQTLVIPYYVPVY